MPIQDATDNDCEMTGSKPRIIRVWTTDTKEKPRARVESNCVPFRPEKFGLQSTDLARIMHHLVLTQGRTSHLCKAMTAGPRR